MTLCALVSRRPPHRGAPLRALVPLSAVFWIFLVGQMAELPWHMVDKLDILQRQITCVQHMYYCEWLFKATYANVTAFVTQAHAINDSETDVELLLTSRNNVVFLHYGSVDTALTCTNHDKPLSSSHFISWQERHHSTIILCKTWFRSLVHSLEEPDDYYFVVKRSLSNDYRLEICIRDVHSTLLTLTQCTCTLDRGQKTMLKNICGKLVRNELEAVQYNLFLQSVQYCDAQYLSLCNKMQHLYSELPPFIEDHCLINTDVCIVVDMEVLIDVFKLIRAGLCADSKYGLRRVRDCVITLFTRNNDLMVELPTNNFKMQVRVGAVARHCQESVMETLTVPLCLSDFAQCEEYAQAHALSSSKVANDTVCLRKPRGKAHLEMLIARQECVSKLILKDFKPWVENTFPNCSNHAEFTFPMETLRNAMCDGRLLTTTFTADEISCDVKFRFKKTLVSCTIVFQTARHVGKCPKSVFETFLRLTETQGALLRVRLGHESSITFVNDRDVSMMLLCASP